MTCDLLWLANIEQRRIRHGIPLLESWCLPERFEPALAESLQDTTFTS